MEIGRSLQSYRKEKGLTQEQLGKIINVSRQTISKWETDRSFPDIENLIWLCDIYEISLDELVGRKQISYEVKVLRKKNRRKDMFHMFPKHTGKIFTGIGITLLLFIGYGLRSIQVEREELADIGLVKLYSVVDMEVGKDGMYEYFELENGEKIEATEKNISDYKLKEKVNAITSGEPSFHSRQVSIDRIRKK